MTNTTKVATEDNNKAFPVKNHAVNKHDPVYYLLIIKNLKMKKSIYTITFLCASIFGAHKVNAQANQQLSNLIPPTAINADLLPNNNNNRNLGSIAKGWSNLYLDSAVYINGSRFLSGPGPLNTAAGESSLNSMTTGFSNTAVGAEALYFNTEGEDNTATGVNALNYSTTASYNTADGVDAGDNIKVGSYNTFVGYYANCGSGGHVTNSIALGNGAALQQIITLRLVIASSLNWWLCKLEQSFRWQSKKEH